MSTPRTNWRNFIARRASVTGGTPESQAINFGMSHGEGIEIAVVEFGATLFANTLTTARVQNHAELSLHAETGELEDVLGPSDSFELNSEVLASAFLLVDTDDNALGELSTYTWVRGPKTNFVQDLGAPMLLAQNPTFLVDGSASTLVMSNPYVTGWFRYVLLTDREQLGLFLMRR